MLLPLLILGILPPVLTRPADQQFLTPTQDGNPGRDFSSTDEYYDQTAAQVQKIAIIGSGIVGAAAAYELAESARQNSRSPSALSITIFEQKPIVGGRITTTQVFGLPELTIDTCAATFNTLVDSCIGRLASAVGLLATPVVGLDNGTAVWNGQEIVGLVEDSGFRDLDTASNFKKARFADAYGEAPFNGRQSGIQTNYRVTGNSFLTFKSLSAATSTSGLNFTLIRGACESETGLCNKQATRNEVYLREVIEAGVRDRFFGDYDELNELNSVLGLSSQRSLSSIDGGNLRLVDRLIRLSGARVSLSSKVMSLEIGTGGKWSVFYSREAKRGVVEQFDKVIIAAPISLANLAITPNVPALPQLKFVDTVVTHFTTRRGLNPTFFRTGLPVPQNILTSATTMGGGRTTLPFFSLRLLDTALIKPFNRTPSDKPENLYKIVSSASLSDEEIRHYLEPDNPSNQDTPAITWINREFLPNSVPRLDRTLKIQDEIEVSSGLFYAGGGAQVVDTIEFGCRMGTNAAGLIVPRPIRGRPGNG